MSAYKLVTLGSSGVGKSSIMLRYVHNTYSDTAVSTIGASFLTKNISLQDGTRYRLELWDTAGQERYASLAPMYYRAAHAALIIYDVTDRSTWERAQKWVQTLKQGERSDMIKVLVGNKVDLPDRTISLQEAQEYASTEKIMHIEVSAKSGAGITAVFNSVTNILAAARSSRRQDLTKDWFPAPSHAVEPRNPLKIHTQKMQKTRCKQC